MGLVGSQPAYVQARAGIARSAAIRSNYVFPLYGVITIDGADLTKYVQYGTLRVTQALNEQPDTAAFDVLLTDSVITDALVVGADVFIGLGGGHANALFGGRVLTTQDTVGPARTPRRRSVICADYLQVLDSEYLITYDWPPQSATVTILDIIARFANKAGGVPISTAGVAAGLPNHASIAVANERCSTVFRRIVTMFPDGGGFYVDPLGVLHVWTGASEPNDVDPQPLTMDLATLTAFAETVDGSQQRDAAIVEGKRTSAPIGTPGPRANDPTGQNIASIPVIDASIFAPPIVPPESVETRIGTQRFIFGRADGVWSAPVGTPQTTVVTTDAFFNPDPNLENNTIIIWIESPDLFTGRVAPWIRIDEQYLQTMQWSMPGDAPPFLVLVPRTGYGAMTGDIKAGATVTVVDTLGGLFITGRYHAPDNPERVRPQPIDADVVLVVRSSTMPAIHEQIVQDGRFSRDGATRRGLQEIRDFNHELISIAFETYDLNAKPGRLQVYDLVDPTAHTPLRGDYMITSTDLSWPVWGRPPLRRCAAATVRAANVVDTWITDQR